MAFKKYVFDKMQKPYRISPKEIIETFCSIATPGGFGCPELEDIDFDSLYTIFVNHLNLHVLSDRHLETFPICATWDLEGLLKQLELQDDPHIIMNMVDQGKINPCDKRNTLWFRNGICLSIFGKSFYKFISKEKYFLIYCIIEGYMSKSTRKQLQIEISRILKSVIRSAHLLRVGYSPKSKQDTHSSYIDDFPVIDERLLLNKKAFIQECLDSYFVDPTIKDSINLRIRNAVHLLIESDAQPNNAVGLALSVAAIEALLGQKGRGDIGEKLAENVAVLLEPEPTKRIKAIKFVKDLYNFRSRALHGEKIEAESHVRRNARHLAAAVLDSMFLVSRMSRSKLAPENPDDLLKSFRDMRFEPGQPLGIDKSNIRKLWCNH